MSANTMKFVFKIFPAIGLLTVATAPFWGQQSTRAKAAEDLPADVVQPKASAACLECHESRIIRQQRLSKAAWMKEVDKMVKWGAVVDPVDRDALVDYLSRNFGPEQPPYQPPRTSREKGAPKTSK